ncbi:hypothetical protein APR09_000033 [Nocardia amikacinitolerans]|nr:hypothetical protein [Nocardia amikacinitolerans]
MKAAATTQSPDLRALDLSFDWAAGEPAPTLESSRIVIDRDAMAGLPRVRERLVRSEEPPRYESLLGIVRTLNRDDLGDGGEEATSIVLSHVDGRSRKVHVPLAGTDYEWAIAAHQSKRPLVVSGNLSFERGAWRLTGDITVDRRLSERSS